MTQTLRSADGRKLVHKRKCMELKLFLPGSPGGSKKKKKKKVSTGRRTYLKLQVSTLKTALNRKQALVEGSLNRSCTT